MYSAISGFFSASLVIGSNLLAEGFTRVNRLRTWLYVAAGAVFISSLLRLLFVGVSRLLFGRMAVAAEEADFCGRRRKLFRDWGLLFLAWLPGFFASFPGVYGYDSVYQVGYYVRNAISLHHPLMHTYLLGFCVITIGNFLGSIEMGMAVYSIIQMLLLSLAFAFSCDFLRQMGLPKIMRVIVLVFYMFLPTNAIMSFSSTKDVLYSASFVALIVCTAKIVTDNRILYDTRFLTKFRRKAERFVNSPYSK